MICSLWGFMGSGKTTIGQLLAQNDQWLHIDSDTEIEKEEGCTITEIFQKAGEEYFRHKETKFLEKFCLDNKVSPRKQIVLTTGGGMPVRAINRQLLKELGPTIFLDVPIEGIIQRLKNDTSRPLWNPEQLLQMQERYEQRLPLYQEASIHINCLEKSAEQIVLEILEQVKKQ